MYSVFAIDVDGDGDVDALSASVDDDTVAWYENDGSQSFTERVITTLADAQSVFAIDVDGDGDVDALSASGGDDTVAWYENDGSQSFTERVITESADFAWSVFAIDVDGDGDVDVLSASAQDDTVAWYENDGSQLFTKFVITDEADGPYSVFATDVDGDGDTDVLSASYPGDTVAWYENGCGDSDASDTRAPTAAPSSSPSAAPCVVSFTETVISNTADGADSVYAIDVDGDGDVDVLSASREDNTVAWYENFLHWLADWHSERTFTKSVLSSSASAVATVFAIDVDGDGDVDVLSASMNDDTAAWYENDGSQSFTERIIPADSASSVFAIDVDGDGDVDVLSASYEDDTVAWCENDGSQSFTERIISDTADGASSVLVPGRRDAARRRALARALGDEGRAPRRPRRPRVARGRRGPRLLHGAAEVPRAAGRVGFLEPRARPLELGQVPEQDAPVQKLRLGREGGAALVGHDEHAVVADRVGVEHGLGVEVVAHADLLLRVELAQRAAAKGQGGARAHRAALV